MKTEPTSASVVASPIDDATASRRLAPGKFGRQCFAASCAGLVACVESGSTPTTTAPQTAAAPAAAATDPALRSGGGQRGEHRVHRGTGWILSRGYRSAGRWRYRLWLAGDGGYPGSGHGSGTRQYPRFFHRKVLAGRPEGPRSLVLVGTFTPVNGQNQTTGPRGGLSILSCAGRPQDGQGHRQRRRPLPARQRRHDAERRLPRELGMDRRSGHAGLYQHLPGHQGRRSHQQGSFSTDLGTASLISQGDQAYNAGQHQSALSLYTAAKATPAGDQLKAYNWHLSPRA